MAAEAILKRPFETTLLTAAAAVASGEVYQLPNGRAAVYTGQNAAASGDSVAFADTGRFTVLKTTSNVWVKGDPIWWDHSANSATCNEPIGAGDRDFYIGTAAEDATSAATTGVVDLNKQVSWIIDSTRDNGDTVIVKTVVGSTTVEVPTVFNVGGMIRLTFGTTAEAQKVDWLSDRSFTLASNWVMEALVEIVTNSDNAAGDLSIGIANGTHATDADSITESVFFHFNGADTNIYAESDDGTTEVAATDTTIDFTAGTPFRLKLDGRNPSDVLYYINGSEVLNGTANLGNIAAAAGPLMALIHAEKTADDSPLEMRVRIRVRTMQQD